MGSGLKLPLVAGVVIVASLAMLATVQSSPPTPHLFYGSVLIDGEDAQVGTVISAEVSGVAQGTTTVTVAGQYGGPVAEDDKLIVSDPGTILFYVGGVLANETTTFSSGAITQFNLTAEAGIETVFIPLSAGFNLIGIPVGLTATTTSRDIAELVLGIPGASDAQIQAGPVISVLGWNVGSQIYDTWAAAVPSSGIFNLTEGGGYFIRVNQDVTVNP